MFDIILKVDKIFKGNVMYLFLAAALPVLAGALLAVPSLVVEHRLQGAQVLSLQLAGRL